MEALTRCINCLRLSRTTNGQCIFEDCPDPGRTEDRAQFLMGARGYRLHHDTLWLVENDDPEDFAEVKISDWKGTHADAFRNLIRHDFPTSSFLICPDCGDGESDFGGRCEFCARNAADELRAGV